MWICGIPSMGETRSFMNSAVGEASNAGTAVGMTISAVFVGMTLGGIVGSGVGVDSVAGTAVVLQAVSKMKETMMNFFM